MDGAAPRDGAGLLLRRAPLSTWRAALSTWRAQWRRCEQRVGGVLNDEDLALRALKLA